MSHIRTVKPDLLKHEDLFDAEQSSNLPLRLAYIGLFTAADCEGRFCWKPRTLKLDVLPYDPVDFSAVLDALERAGFIRRYEVDGKQYGVIPTFKKHQQISTRESERGSSYPPPPALTSTEHEPVRVEARTEHEPVRVEARTEHEPVRVEARTELCSEFREGKGREGKGKRKGKDNTAALRAPAHALKTALPADLSITDELRAWATAHGYPNLELHLEAFKDKAIAKGYQYADWNAALRNAIRDDWAGLRKTHPTNSPRSSVPITHGGHGGTEFGVILSNLHRPVIEGEISNECR